MRELLYVSKRKLDSFVIRGKAAVANAEMEVQVPLLTVRLGTTASPGLEQTDWGKLEKVIRQLDRGAVEWTDADASPGTWVRFDLHMGFSVFDEFTGRYPVALFAGALETGVSQERRLLLCGSPVHILGSGFKRDNYWASSGRHLDHVAQLIEGQDAQPEVLDEDEDVGAPHQPVDASELVRKEVVNAYRLVARDSPRRTHARLSGHARVLVREEPNNLVAATPLYVQYGELTPSRRFLRPGWA